MFLLRRAAIRSFSSQLPTRSIATKAPSGLRQAQKWQPSAFQRRFASDDASPVQEKTSGETVTTEPTESEKAQQEEAGASVTTEAQAEQESDVTEKSVATPDVADAAEQTKTPTIEQVAEKVQDVAATMRQTASSAAESLLGKSTRGSHGDAAASKILYAGNLFFEVKSQDLEREFSKFGTITNCRVAEDSRGLSRGFGFVEFADVESAAKAKEEMNDQVLAGRNMAVQFHVRREPRNLARPSSPEEPAKTLFIGNMSFQMSDKDLNDIFRPIKNVLDVRVAVDRRSGQPRGFCHADFIDIPSAEAAKKVLEQKEIYGRRLRVDYSRTNMRNSRDDGGMGSSREDGDRRSSRDGGDRRSSRDDGDRRSSRDDGERRNYRDYGNRRSPREDGDRRSTRDEGDRRY